MNNETSGKDSNIRLLLFILLWLGGVLIGFHELNVQGDSRDQKRTAASHLYEIGLTSDKPTRPDTILIGRSHVTCSNMSINDQANPISHVFKKSNANVAVISPADFALDSAQTTDGKMAAIISGGRRSMDGERYPLHSLKFSNATNFETVSMSGCSRFSHSFSAHTRDTLK